MKKPEGFVFNLANENRCQQSLRDWFGRARLRCEQCCWSITHVPLDIYISRCVVMLSRNYPRNLEHRGCSKPAVEHRWLGRQSVGAPGK
jgi:hypothetical protein